MRTLEIDTWPRREHFRKFLAFNHPHFGVSANVDVTALRKHVRQHGHSFTVAVVYLIARAANAIPEFRLRIRGNSVVEHERVHPSFTIATVGDLFGFCTVPYVDEFHRFAARAAEEMALARMHPRLEDEGGRDDLLYMTAFPWVSFTAFMHPMQQHPADSVPRFAFGRVFGDPRSRQMPLGVQGHHALMDGVHVGNFYTQLQYDLNNPGPALR